MVLLLLLLLLQSYIMYYVYYVLYYHFFLLYKLLCDIELTRTRFVRVTSKSVGGGSSGSNGGNRPRREIDIIIILFFVWSVSQTSLCVYATTCVRTCATSTTQYCPSSSSKVPPRFHPSSVTTPYTVTIIIVFADSTCVRLYVLIRLRRVFGFYFFHFFFVIFCLQYGFTCETISPCSPASRHP